MQTTQETPSIYSKIKYVAIYLRKSRNEEGVDDDEVLLKHRNQLLHFVEENKFKYDMFQEIGSSDTIEFRPEFSRLLERIKTGVYDAVVAIDLDRITRGDSYEYGYIKRVFAEGRTLILTPYGEVIDLSDEMNIMNDMKATLGRYEYLQTKKRFKEGKIRSARLGRWVNGTPPIGYDYDKNTKRLVIDEHYAEMVRMIFDLYVNEGFSLQDIGFELNRKGYKGRRGGYFQEIQISRMLQNETYIGNIVFGKSEGSGHKNKKTKPLQAKSEDEWIRVEDTHEPIVDRDIFEKAAVKLAKKQKIPRKARQEVFTLSGLVRCGRCNSIMRLMSKRLATGTMALYVRKCQHADPFGTRCQCSGCNSEIILRALKQHLEDYRNNLLNASSVVDEDSRKRIQMKVNQAKEEVKRLEAGVDRIKSLFIDGFIDKNEMEQRTDDQNKKLDVARRELRSIEFELKQASNDTVDKKIELVEKIASQLDVTNPFDPSLNKLLRELVDCIHYDRSGNDIRINVEFY